MNMFPMEDLNTEFVRELGSVSDEELIAALQMNLDSYDLAQYDFVSIAALFMCAVIRQVKLPTTTRVTIISRGTTYIFSYDGHPSDAERKLREDITFLSLPSDIDSDIDVEVQRLLRILRFADPDVRLLINSFDGEVSKFEFDSNPVPSE